MSAISNFAGEPGVLAAESSAGVPAGAEVDGGAAAEVLDCEKTTGAKAANRNVAAIVRILKGTSSRPQRLYLSELYLSVKSAAPPRELFCPTSGPARIWHHPKTLPVVGGRVT